MLTGFEKILDERTDPTFVDYEFHPFCLLMPFMNTDDFERFVENVRTQGQTDPIVIWNKKVIDGRHRHEANRALGRGDKLIEVEFESGWHAYQYVVAKNMMRRNASAGQRACAAFKAISYYQTIRATHPELVPGDLRQFAANEYNVSAGYLQYAGVLSRDHPDLFELVHDGSMPMADALRAKELRENEEDEGPTLPQGDTGQYKQGYEDPPRVPASEPSKPSETPEASKPNDPPADPAALAAIQAEGFEWSIETLDDLYQKIEKHGVKAVDKDTLLRLLRTLVSLIEKNN